MGTSTRPAPATARKRLYCDPFEEGHQPTLCLIAALAACTTCPVSDIRLPTSARGNPPEPGGMYKQSGSPSSFGRIKGTLQSTPLHTRAPAHSTLSKVRCGLHGGEI